MMIPGLTLKQKDCATAFFYVRITHVNSHSHKNQPTSKVFRRHEQAKKREYMQRVLDIEHGSLTPLVFWPNDGMGNECAQFISALASKLSYKNNEKYPDVVTWLRTRLSIEILRSALLCVRGSRFPFRKRHTEDFGLMNIQANQIQS